MSFLQPRTATIPKRQDTQQFDIKARFRGDSRPDGVLTWANFKDLPIGHIRGDVFYLVST